MNSMGNGNTTTSNPTILVVGGAGYVGSHMVDLLLRKGHHVVVVDNLSSGCATAVGAATLVQGDLGDQTLLTDVFKEFTVDAVMHFAAHIEVGESITAPAKYYDNNLAGVLRLLDAMRAHNINRFIFSSTAAVFGEPQYTPIDENHPKNPLSPYGRSKWMVEQILADYAHAYDLKHICLRYFNACGAHPQGHIGECHQPETHLIPLVLQAASHRRADVRIYGDDYDTDDGTCVRDYVHVCDLARAHLLALEALKNSGESAAYNLGNECGFSVRQIVETIKKVTQQEFDVVVEKRRIGDPAVLIANARRAREMLGWTPHYTDLETIVKHAWVWEKILMQHH